MFKIKASKLSLAVLSMIALSAPAAYADSQHAACHPGWDEDCVDSKATLVPAISVKGLECLDFGKIALCNERSNSVDVTMDKYGTRTSSNKDLATPIGAKGTAAKFEVKGSKGSEFCYTVTATELKRTGDYTKKLYLTPNPTGDTSEMFANGNAWETTSNYYQVAGKLTIPKEATPGYYTGQVCLRAEYK